MFKDKGYLIVKNFTDIKDLYEQSKVLANSDTSKEYDPQCPLSQGFYNSPPMDMLHKNKLDDMEKYTGLKLFRTYNFWRMYKEGETLLRHSDREGCEISVTLFLGGDPWDIYIKGYDGIVTKVTQKPGDALIYRGCDLFHWREEFEGDNCAQVFLHYVDQNGPNAWAKDDIRK